MMVKPSATLTAPTKSSIEKDQANVRAFDRTIQRIPIPATQQEAVPLDLEGYQLACLPFSSS